LQEANQAQQTSLNSTKDEVHQYKEVLVLDLQIDEDDYSIFITTSKRLAFVIFLQLHSQHQHSWAKCFYKDSFKALPFQDKCKSLSCQEVISQHLSW